MFDDFLIREVDLATLEERKPLNVLDYNGMVGVESRLVDFAVDKELGFIAMISPSSIYIFDFNYEFIRKIFVDGLLERVLFCQYYIVVMANVGESVCLITY